MIKICKQCQIEKPLDEFYKMGEKNLYYHNICKQCTLKNKAIKTKTESKTCPTCNQVKPLTQYSGGTNKICFICAKKSQQPNRSYLVFKAHAKKRGIENNITEDQYYFLFENYKHCLYCEADMPKISLDRIDNLIGYEINNVVPCCRRCNPSKKQKVLKTFLEKKNIFGFFERYNEFKKDMEENLNVKY